MQVKKQSLKSAFTLIELMVVVGIIAIIAAAVVHNYLQVIIISRESAAISNLKSAANSCRLYLNQFEEYPAEFSDLGDYLSSDFIAVVEGNPQSDLHGYYFAYTPPSEDEECFSLNADPKSPLSGKRHFYVDDSLVIRVNFEEPATDNDPPL